MTNHKWFVLENHITPDEEAELRYLESRVNRHANPDKAYTELCEYADELKRKYHR